MTNVSVENEIVVVTGGSGVGVIAEEDDDKLVEGCSSAVTGT